jgi:hypothetical protein
MLLFSLGFVAGIVGTVVPLYVGFYAVHKALEGGVPISRRPSQFDGFS